MNPNDETADTLKGVTAKLWAALRALDYITFPEHFDYRGKVAFATAIGEARNQVLNAVDMVKE